MQLEGHFGVRHSVQRVEEFVDALHWQRCYLVRRFQPSLRGNFVYNSLSGHNAQGPDVMMRHGTRLSVSLQSETPEGGY